MLVAIGGSSRSGTTMMYELFTGDRKTNSLLPESVPLQHLVNAYDETRTCEQQTDWFPDADPRPLYTSFVRQLLEQVPGESASSSEVAEHFVVKCPTMTPHLASLGELVEDLRCIVLVRDPRDVITSQVKVARRQIEKLGRASNANHAAGDPQRLAILVIQAYEAVMREGAARLGDRLLFVRYEDFVREPAVWVERLREHTGVELAHFEAEKPVSKIPECFGGGYRTELSSGPVVPKSVGGFREFLPADALAVIERATAPFLKLWGYVPVAGQGTTATWLSEEVPAYRAFGVTRSPRAEASSLS